MPQSPKRVGCAPVPRKCRLCPSAQNVSVVPQFPKRAGCAPVPRTCWLCPSPQNVSVVPQSTDRVGCTPVSRTSRLCPSPQNVPADVFERECARCGRTLDSREQHVWRWSGFNYDVDIIMIFNGRDIRIKRTTSTLHSARQIKRTMMYRYRGCVEMSNDVQVQGMRRNAQQIKRTMMYSGCVEMPSRSNGQ